MKISDFIPEIIELQKQGYTSSKVHDWLLENKNLNVKPRRIREVMQNNGSPFRDYKAKNTCEDILEKRGFDPIDNWNRAWVKTKEGTVELKNDTKGITKQDYQELFAEISKEIKPIKLPKIKTKSKKALRSITSDIHIGMNPNTEDALFGFEYNESVYKKNLSILYDKVNTKIENEGRYDKIILDDLGDGLDGYNRETTRGGHKLPQNMSNKEAWKVYVLNKINTYASIIKTNGASSFEIRDVSNCNHSGDWGYTANYAVKMALERMFDNVKYTILERFMEHFTYGNHTHILTHGKDKENMFKGLPFKLNAKTVNFISQYIDHYEIKSKHIHVDKGDLHQIGYERDPKFDYTNYMSFAPPSAWVQANFGVSYCGFSLQEIPKFTNEIEQTNIFFDLKKK